MRMGLTGAVKEILKQAMKLQALQLLTQLPSYLCYLPASLLNDQIFKCVCRGGAYVSMSIGSHGGQKRVWYSLELELQVAGNCSVWVLGTVLQCSKKVPSVLYG